MPRYPNGYVLVAFLGSAEPGGDQALRRFNAGRSVALGERGRGIDEPTAVSAGGLGLRGGAALLGSTWSSGGKRPRRRDQEWFAIQPVSRAHYQRSNHSATTFATRLGWQ